MKLSPIIIPNVELKNFIIMCNLKYSNNVNLEIAKLAHELGWNLYTTTQYIVEDEKYVSLSLEQCAITEICGQKTLIYIPTFEQIFNWFCEKYELYIMITPDWGYKIYDISFGLPTVMFESGDNLYFTYTSACQAAMKLLLENLLSDYNE